METLPQNIYLNILAQVVESVSHELSINDNTKEQEVIMTLSGALGRCFESIQYISFFQNPIINKVLEVDVYGEKRKWIPDIYIETNDGYGFFIEVNMNKGCSIRDLSLRLYSRLDFLEKLHIVGGVLIYIDPSTAHIQVEQIAKGNELSEVSIFEQSVEDGHAKVAILIANPYSSHPDEILDKAVLQYVGNKPYNQFVDTRNDNQWVRIVTTGINKISYKPFEQHRL